MDDDAVTEYEKRSVELERRLAKLRRAQRAQRLYMLVVFAFGIAAGYALAEAVIDPIVVLPACGGISV